MEYFVWMEQANGGWKQENNVCVCVYMFFLHIDLCFYVFICLFHFIYLRIFKIDACISTYKHVLQHWQWTVFLGAKPAQNGGKQTLFLTFFKQNFIELRPCKTKTPKMVNQQL